MGGRGSGRPQFRTAGTVPDDGGELFPGGAPDAGDEDLAAALEQFPEGAARIRIYKWGRGQGAAGMEEGWLRCVTVPAGDFDADQIPARWGAGAFRFQVIGSDGRTVKHFRQSFAAPAVLPSAADQQPRIGPVAPAGAVTDSMQAFMLQMFANQQQLLLAVLGRPAASSDVKVGDVLSAFREGRSMAPAAPSHEGIIEALRLGVEVAGERGGGSGGDNGGGGSMLENIAGRVLGILDRAMTAPAPAALNNPPARPPVAEAQPAPAGDPLLAVARQYAPLLIAEATKGRDAFTWGSFVGERIPDAWMPVLKKLVDATPAERIRVLSSVDPRLAQHADWIETAAEGIRDAFYGDDASASTGGGGDLDHGHADPGDDPRGGSPSDGARSGGPR